MGTLPAGALSPNPVLCGRVTLSPIWNLSSSPLGWGTPSTGQFSLICGLHSLFSYLSLHHLVAHLRGLEQLLIANASIWKITGSAGWLSTAVKEWLELHCAGHPWGSVMWLSVGGLLGAWLGCQWCSCGLSMRLGLPAHGRWVLRRVKERGRHSSFLNPLWIQEEISRVI